jgi:hypothetical protein
MTASPRAGRPRLLPSKAVLLLGAFFLSACPHGSVKAEAQASWHDVQETFTRWAEIEGGEVEQLVLQDRLEEAEAKQARLVRMTERWDGFVLAVQAAFAAFDAEDSQDHRRVLEAAVERARAFVLDELGMALPGGV